MKPTIIFVITTLGIGGAEKQLLGFINYAFKNNISINIIVIHFGQSEHDLLLVDDFKRLGIETILVSHSNKTKPFFLKNLFRTIRALHPTIVHTFLVGTPSTWGRLSAILNGIPFIFHSDRNLNPPVSRIHYLIRPFLDERTIRFLPNADAIAQWLVNIGVNPKKIRIITNGVDTTLFNPDVVKSPREKWGMPDNAILAGFLGKYRQEKRLDLLFDALLLLPESKRPNGIILGGDGPLLHEIQKRINENAWLRKHCHLLGIINNVPEFMAGIDYLILCSDYEGLPNVVLEAMAMRKPIVTTNVSDLSDIIKGIGFIAEPGNAQSLAEALKEMQELTPKERAEYGIIARDRILEKYEYNMSAQHFWDAHMEVLNS